MGLGTILLIVLLLILIGSIPVFPYSRGWGYAPMGGIGALLVVIIVLIALGVIPLSTDGGSVSIDVPDVNIVETN